VPGGNPFAQSQAFQPPATANAFTFNMPGAQAPSFGQTPQPNGNPFGTSAPDQANQNGGSIFGGLAGNQSNTAPNFSSGFSQNTSQQNGFNPSSSFNFGQTQNNGSTPGTSFTFGQSQSQGQQQPQTNGFNPSTSSTFGASFGGPKSQESGATPSFTFGQSQPTQEQTSKPSAPSFGGFGESQQNGNRAGNASIFSQPAPQAGDKPAGTGLFGSTPAAETPKSGESIFSGLKSTTNGIKPGMFTQSQPNGEQAPKPSFSFGQPAGGQSEQQADKPPSTFSFGQSATQTTGEQTPKPSVSFGGFNFAQQGQQNREPTPKPTSTFSFGQSTQGQAGKPTEPAQQTPKPSNLFNGHGASHAEQTPKPATNTFSGFGQTQPQPPAMSPPKFGASHLEDTSMLSPENTPHKQSSTQPAKTPRATPAQQPNGNAGNDLFSRISPADPPVPNGTWVSGPSTKEWEADSEAPIFDERHFNDLLMRSLAPGQRTTATAQSSSLSPARADLKRLNDGLVAHLQREDPTQDWSVIFSYYLKEAARIMGKDAYKRGEAPSTASQSVPQSADNPKPTSSTPAPAETPKASMTNMFSRQASSNSLFNTQTPQPPATAPVSKKRTANEDLTRDHAESTMPATDKRSKPNEPVQYPKLPETASNTAKLFASTLDKPVEKPAAQGSDQQNGIGSRFGPPADVMAKLREQKAAKEAAEKADAEKTPAPTPSHAATPSTAFKFGGAASTASPEKPTEAPKAPSFGFTPSSSSSAPATSGFKLPSFGAPPAAGSANFLSSFGQKAVADEEKARKRRKAEDYDSDEEDEAAWEARDRAEQEEKRRKIEEAAKTGPSFKFPATTDKPAASSTPFAFKLPGADKPAETETSANAGKSLFDRLGPLKTPAEKDKSEAPAASVFSPSSTFSAPTPKPANTGFSFGQPNAGNDTDAAKTQGEKALGSGDNTWNPDTPIKFGNQTTATSTTPAAPPPANPFSGLFGSSTCTPAASKEGTSEPGKLAPPSIGFNFGQKAGTSGASTADASRATTPGVTTDGEASAAGDATEAGEPSDEPKDKKVEDMTALLPEELEAEEVVAQAPMAKASKYDDRNTEDGVKKAWVERGKGPLYVLKNKSTGKVRILLKVPPLGRLSMNFEPLKGAAYTNPKPKFINGPFIDHLETNNEKAPGIKPWQIQVKEPADAEKIAKALMDGRPS